MIYLTANPNLICFCIKTFHIAINQAILEILRNINVLILYLELFGMAAEIGAGAGGTSTNPPVFSVLLEPRTWPVSGLTGIARLLRLQQQIQI